MRRFSWRLAAMLCVVALVTGCALIRPGDDPIVVRTQDVISNSFDAWDSAMDVHAAASASESPAVYKAMEQLRTKFPASHRAVRDALKAYQAAKTKDPGALRLAVNGFLADVAALAPPGSKFAQTIGLIRAAFNGGA